MIDRNDNCVAEIRSPHQPNQTPAEFYRHAHQTQAKSGPWEVSVRQVDITARRNDQFSDQCFSPKLEFVYSGQLLDKSEFVSNSLISDALGNPLDSFSTPSRNAPLWKYSLQLARSDYQTSRQAAELREIGRIEQPNANRQFSPTADNEVKISSIHYFAVGTHELNWPVIESPDRRFGLPLFNNFRRDRLRPSSSSVSIGQDESIFEAKYSNGFDNEEIITLEVVERKNQQATMKLVTKQPIVILQFAHPFEDSLVNLFAFDHLNRSLAVSSLEQSYPTLRVFAIEAEDATQLDLFYSIEPIVKIDLYMVPPTKGLGPAINDTKQYTLEPTSDGWNILSAD